MKFLIILALLLGSMGAQGLDRKPTSYTYGQVDGLPECEGVIPPDSPVWSIYGVGKDVPGDTNQYLHDLTDPCRGNLYGRDKKGLILKQIRCTHAMYKRTCAEKNISSEDCKLNVFVSGYSRGGIAALEVVENLEKYSDLLVIHLDLIDPVTVTGSGKGLRIPSYVKSAVSYYEQAKKEDRCSGGPYIGTPLVEATNSTNVFAQGNWNHCSIPQFATPLIKERIKKIDKNLCR